MAAHVFWRFSFAGTDTGSTLTVAEVELRTSVGGSNVATWSSSAPTDSSSNALVFTRNAGYSKSGLVHSTAQSNSARFDGSAAGLTIAANSLFDRGTGDWTIEGLLTPAGFGNSWATVFGNRSGSYGAGCCALMLQGTSGSFPQKLVLVANGLAGHNLATTTTLGANVPYWFSLTKNANVLYMHLNGTKEAQVNDSGNYNWSSVGTAGVAIGNDGWDGANGYLNAYVERFRFTAAARYSSANYTPPSGALPVGSGADPTYWSNTALLFQFDEAGDPQAVTGTATNAFDANNSTNWAATSMTQGWLVFQFSSAQDIVEHAITAPSATMTNAPSRWILQYSDDAVSWTTAAIVGGQTGWTSNEKRVFTHSSYPAAIGLGVNLPTGLVARTNTVPTASTHATLRMDPGLQTAPMLTGTVKQSGVNVARTVRAYCRLTGEILGEATSDGTTGAFSINARGRTDNCYVIALDDLTNAPDYNAVIYDLVIPV